MTVQEWSMVIGVVTSALLALAPWMFMVHAKLAVLATRMSNVEEKVDKLIEAHDQQLPKCAQHDARLDSHDVQLGYVNERLEDLA
jgi:hypothetical protein